MTFLKVKTSWHIKSIKDMFLKSVVLGLLSTLTGGLQTIHIDPTKGNTKLRQVVSLNETQVYPIPFYWDVNVNWII